MPNSASKYAVLQASNQHFSPCKQMQGMIYSKILPVITVTIDQLCAPVMIIGLGFIDTSFWSLISLFIGFIWKQTDWILEEKYIT